MRTLAMLGRLRLDVAGVHDEPIALLEAFRRCYNRRAEDFTDTLCFIDIGATTTKVVIAQGGRMLFAKVINVGGDAAARELADAREVPFSEARRMRIDAASGQAPPTPAGEDDRRRVVAPSTLGRIGPEGFAAAGGDESVAAAPARGSTGIPALDAQLEEEGDGGVATLAPPAPAPAAPPRGAAITDELDGDLAEHLLDELQMCVRYFAQLRPSQPIRKLIFCGGEARHTRLCQQVAQRLRIAAQLGDPFARLTTDTARPPRCTGMDPDAPQPGWAVPLGLCLIGVSR